MIMLTTNSYKKNRDMRNNNFDPNGCHHSVLGILHVGDCCRLSCNTSVSNTMITGKQGNNFQCRTKYGHIVGMQVNDEGQMVGCFDLWLQANFLPFGLETP
jgi:hypothetical protein